MATQITVLILLEHLHNVIINVCMFPNNLLIAFFEPIIQTSYIINLEERENKNQYQTIAVTKYISMIVAKVGQKQTKIAYYSTIM